MGFEAPRGVAEATIAFATGAYAGSEVRLRLGMPMREFLAGQRLVQEQIRAGTYDEDAAVRAWFESRVTGWNLEADGVPLPLTWESAAGLESDFLYNVRAAWLTAVQAHIGVAAPLGPPSPSGGPSEGDSGTTAQS